MQALPLLINMRSIFDEVQVNKEGDDVSAFKHSTSLRPIKIITVGVSARFEHRTVEYSPADIAGLNRITRKILDNAPNGSSPL